MSRSFRIPRHIWPLSVKSKPPSRGFAYTPLHRLKHRSLHSANRSFKWNCGLHSTLSPTTDQWIGAPVLDILSLTMASDSFPSQSSPRDRREFYRITSTLSIRLQAETDTSDGPFSKVPVNLSAGGIGVTINTAFQANEILLCTLLLPDQEPFRVYVEVLRIDLINTPPHTFRLHGRFVRMSTPEREFLVRTILHLQREHLAKHYSA